MLGNVVGCLWVHGVGVWLLSTSDISEHSMLGNVVGYVYWSTGVGSDSCQRLTSQNTVCWVMFWAMSMGPWGWGLAPVHCVLGKVVGCVYGSIGGRVWLLSTSDISEH